MTSPCVELQSSGIWINGRPLILLTSSLFYFRLPSSEWRSRMRCLRLLGYNAIDVYFPWNYHELEPGLWNFSGERDVRVFLHQAKAEGLWVVARPGPYICSEWDGGALPAYLSVKPDLKLRDNDLDYLEAVAASSAVFEETMQPLTVLLILKAFASGCTALTGVEAISNGIMAFKTPRSRNAAQTMIMMSSLLAVMFIGITVLANQVQVVAGEGMQETVISQIARTLYGVGPLYYITLAATTIILILAANTSYNGFPLLGALIAADSFLPKQLTYRGRRLVFSWGIVALALAAALLVVIFQAETSRLIPLYAIGVFMSFTLSQAGMVMRWRRSGKMKPDEELETHGSFLRYDRHWRSKQIVNAVGATMTFIVMIIFAVAKFTVAPTLSSSSSRCWCLSSSAFIVTTRP